MSIVYAVINIRCLCSDKVVPEDSVFQAKTIATFDAKVKVKASRLNSRLELSGGGVEPPPPQFVSTDAHF